MITSLRLTNFKCFKRLNLPEVAQITLVGGRNNVGKTALLEALALFYGRVSPRMFSRHLMWRGVNNISNASDFVIGPLFKDYQMENTISISVTDDNHEETMEIEFHPTYTHRAIEPTVPDKRGNRSQDDMNETTSASYIVDITYKSSGSQERKAQVIQDAQLSEVQGDQSLLYSSKVVFVTANAGFNSDVDANRFGQLDIIGKRQIIIDFLKILEPRLQDLSAIAVGQKLLIHGDIGIGRKIPLAHMGEGMGRLLSIVLSIAISRDGLILIDEFEHGLHHSGMVQLWEGISRMAAEYNCQIIASTHSYTNLQSAYQGILDGGSADNFRYIRLDRIADGTVAKTYSHEMLGVALESNWEVR